MALTGWSSAVHKPKAHGTKVKQEFLPTLPSVRASGAALIPYTLSQEAPWLPGTEAAGNKSLLQELSEAIGKFVNRETCMYVVCAPALDVHIASEFHTGCLYRHTSST